MNLLINFALLLVVLNCRFTYTSSRFRIVEGEPANIEDMPYMVALTYFLMDGAFCSGSLVTMQTVVTSAHCLEKREVSLITIVAGSADIRCPVQSRKVERTFHSCSYNRETLRMDVGAVKLKASFDPSPTIKPIPLCNIDLKPDLRMQVSGWGATNEDKEDYQMVLRTTVTPIRKQNMCAYVYSLRSKTIYESMICGRNDGTGPCIGDSGGPGVVDGQLCGVASSVMGCASYKYPTVYTNVKYIGVLRFIQKAMKC